MKVLVVVPTLNERRNIELLVAGVLALGTSFTLLIVDDASADGTAQAVAGLVPAYPGRLHLLRRRGRSGLGAAYRDGFRWGLERGYDFVCEMDADLSHDPADLPRFIGTLVGGRADVLIGSRYVRGGTTPGWSASRRALSRVAGLATRGALGVRVTDPTSGFRGYTRAALQAIDVQTTLAEGFAFQVEVLCRCLSLGLRVVEMPISFRPRRSGRSKMTWRSAAEGLAVLWRLRSAGVASAGRSLPHHNPA